MTNHITINQEETINQLKSILGENYCDWNHPDFLYTITKMANDITHLKTDNQVWYDKVQELEQLSQQPERERERESNQRKKEIIW